MAMRSALAKQWPIPALLVIGLALLTTSWLRVPHASHTAHPAPEKRAPAQTQPISPFKGFSQSDKDRFGDVLFWLQKWALNGIEPSLQNTVQSVTQLQYSVSKANIDAVDNNVSAIAALMTQLDKFRVANGYYSDQIQQVLGNDSPLVFYLADLQRLTAALEPVKRMSDQDLGSSDKLMWMAVADARMNQGGADQWFSQFLQRIEAAKKALRATK